MNSHNRRLKARADKRRRDMQAMRDKGSTLHEIAASYEISVQRVHQILGPKAAAAST